MVRTTNPNPHTRSQLMYRIFASLILFCTTLVVPSQSALAQPVTVPAGLAPGDQYRLAYVTSSVTTLPTNEISYYNQFVTTDANSFPALAALGTTWTAIVSTDGVNAVNASDNTDTNPSVPGVPIYNLGGSLVAENNSRLWGVTGVIQSYLSAPIDIAGNGIVILGTPAVWTGTGADGEGLYPIWTPATDIYGRVHPYYADTGSVGSASPLWIGSGDALDGEPNGGSNLALYAISAVLTVPIPEPSTLVLGLFAAAGLAVPMFRRRRHRKP
jgi:hypothetical protein